ncbi:MAG: hypothetical protein HY954_11805 [Deltaproteobacteria bacterium]|nr:hypothetical protein [Deltaproteobacteria bacterium]
MEGALKNTVLSLTALLSILLSGTANAELAIGISKDIIHAEEANALLLRYDLRDWHLGGQGMVWNFEDKLVSSIGLDLTYSISLLDFNIGLAYISDISEINGTHRNFSLGTAINIGEHSRVNFTHFSNGHNENNNGWNFLGLSYRF